MRIHPGIVGVLYLNGTSSLPLKINIIVNAVDENDGNI